jgi:hypothetical protein
MTIAKGVEIIVLEGHVRETRGHIRLTDGVGEAFLEDIHLFASFEDGTMSDVGFVIAELSPNDCSITCDLPDRIVKAIEVRCSRDGVGVSYESDYELLDLLPSDDKLYKGLNRAKDIETLIYSARQLIMSTERSLMDKVEGLKIISYKYIETINLDGMEWAGEQIDLMADLLETAPPAKGNSKFHPTHAYVSLMFIRSTMAVMRMDYPGYINALSALKKNVANTPKAPIIGFNLSQALLVYGRLLHAAGLDEDATEALEMSVETFRASASHMSIGRPMAFSELEMTLKAATQAAIVLAHIRKLNGAKYKPPLSFKRLSREFSRVKTEDACVYLAERMERFVDLFDIGRTPTSMHTGRENNS